MKCILWLKRCYPFITKCLEMHRLLFFPLYKISFFSTLGQYLFPLVQFFKIHICSRQFPCVNLCSKLVSWNGENFWSARCLLHVIFAHNMETLLIFRRCGDPYLSILKYMYIYDTPLLHGYPNCTYNLLISLCMHIIHSPYRPFNLSANTQHNLQHMHLSGNLQRRFRFLFSSQLINHLRNKALSNRPLIWSKKYGSWSPKINVQMFFGFGHLFLRSHFGKLGILFVSYIVSESLVYTWSRVVLFLLPYLMLLLIISHNFWLSNLIGPDSNQYIYYKTKRITI